MPPKRVRPAAVFPAHRYGLIQPQGDVEADSVVRSALALIALLRGSPGSTRSGTFRSAGTVAIEPSPGSGKLERAAGGRLAGSRTLVVTGGRRAVAFAAPSYGGIVRPLGRSAVVCPTVEDVLRLLPVGSPPGTVGRPGRRPGGRQRPSAGPRPGAGAGPLLCPR